MSRYKEKLSPPEELLVLAVKDGRTEEERQKIAAIYRNSGDEVIYKAAIQNKVVPLVAHGLMDSVPAEELDPRWVLSHSETEKKLTLFFAELDQLAAICEKSSISIVAIENGGVARGVQQCHGCFASSDIEVLVAYENLIKFEQILSSEGYERSSRERCASEKTSQWDREIIGWDNYCKTLGDNVVFWINVQWRPVLRRWVPMEQGLVTTDLINRSVPISDASSRVRILAPEDNLLVCALHVASHSYVRGIGLRLQLDVDRLVRNVKIDWDNFLGLVSEHQAAKLVFPSLAIPHGLFNTPIPEYIFSALIPSSRKRTHILNLIAKAGVLNRTAHKFSPVQIVKLELSLSQGGFISSMRRVLFPPMEWMQEGYRLRNHKSPMFWYIHRLVDLAKRKHA